MERERVGFFDIEGAQEISREQRRRHLATAADEVQQPSISNITYHDDGWVTIQCRKDSLTMAIKHEFSAREFISIVIDDRRKEGVREVLSRGEQFEPKPIRPFADKVGNGFVTSSIFKLYLKIKLALHNVTGPTHVQGGRVMERERVGFFNLEAAKKMVRDKRAQQELELAEKGEIKSPPHVVDQAFEMHTCPCFAILKRCLHLIFCKLKGFFCRTRVKNVGGDDV